MENNYKKIVLIERQEVNNWNALKFNNNIDGVIITFYNDENDVIKMTAALEQCRRLDIDFGICIDFDIMNSKYNYNIDKIKQAVDLLYTLIKYSKLSYPILYKFQTHESIRNSKVMQIIDTVIPNFDHCDLVSVLYSNSKSFIDIYNDTNLKPNIKKYNICVENSSSNIYDMNICMRVSDKIETISGINEEVKIITTDVDFPKILASKRNLG